MKNFKYTIYLVDSEEFNLGKLSIFIEKTGLSLDAFEHDIEKSIYMIYTNSHIDNACFERICSFCKEQKIVKMRISVEFSNGICTEF